MPVATTAKTTAWCLHCPDTIRVGDQVLIDDAYAKPGSTSQPMIHAHCEGLPMYDPDAHHPADDCADDDADLW